MRFTSQQDVEYERVMEVTPARVRSAGGAQRLKGLSDEVQRMLLKMAPKKRPGRVTVEDFEGLTEAIDAKRRLMERWRDKGVCYQAAVIEYAHEYTVTMLRAVEAVNDMEILTGVRLERCDG